MIVDGVGYTPGQIRRLVQERYELAAEFREYKWTHELCNDGCVPGAAYRDLAEENTRLRLSVGRLQRAAESQQVHLQRRTAALIRLIARKGPRLDEPTEPVRVGWDAR